MADPRGGGTPAGAFRAKVAMMKSWRPENPPSNRDRLEIYALHKQAVSGDAPAKDPPDASVADRAKLNAWRSKRGMTQAEAMSAYATECDRQLRVYGTRSERVGGDESSTATTPGGPGGTPTNTPSANRPDDGGGDGPGSALLTPRGVAAVPLLCAAAAESRAAYLSRLHATGPPANGWWAKQEPLCAEPGTPLAAPEGAVIKAASGVEYVSLLAGTEWASKLPVPPAALQAYLWPIHNVLLAVWIVLIFISTLAGSSIVMTKTVLLGAKRTGAPLDQLFVEEVMPASRAAASLCDPHQAIAVRLAGLALMPFVTLCNAAQSVSDAAGVLAGTGLYVFAAVMTWWYWVCCLPWMAFGGVCTAVTIGWCFALIELAGV